MQTNGYFHLKEELLVSTRLKQNICVALLCALLPAGAAALQLAGKKGLTLELAKKVAAAAEAAAVKNKWTMVIAVVDDGGHLIYLQRMDEAQFGSVEMATQKAQSAVAFKRPTKAFEEAVAGGRSVILKVPGAMPVEGGVPVTVGGKVIGAIGVSGGTSQQDGVVAQAGLEALQKILGGGKDN